VGGKGLKVKLRHIVGVLIGFIIFAEGAVLASAGRPVTIEGVGTIMAGTVLLIGAQIAILGFLIMFFWLLEWADFIPKKGRIMTVMDLIGLLVAAIVTAEGLFFTTNAAMISFEDGRVFGKVATALMSAQLFGLGLLCLMLWLKRKQVDTNFLVWFAGVASAGVVLAWGAVLIGCQADLFITDFGGISAVYVLTAGAVIMALGLVPLMVWTVHGTKYYGEKFKRFGTIALTLSMLTLAFAFMALATIADDFTIGDFFTGKKIWMAGWCGLMFFFAVLALAAWWSRRVPLKLIFVPQMLGTLAGVLLAAEGVVLIGFAGETHLETLGVLSETMTLLIAVQLALLSSIVLGAWLFRSYRWFKGNFNRMLLDMLMLILIVVLTLEGVAIMVLAAPITIDGIGTMLESTMVLFGLQLALVSLLSLLCWVFRDDGSLPRMQRFMFIILVFLGLLIPPALLL
jgi:hypothetical protein